MELQEIIYNQYKKKRWLKLVEEMGELTVEIIKSNPEGILNEFADVINIIDQLYHYDLNDESKLKVNGIMKAKQIRQIERIQEKLKNE